MKYIIGKTHIDISSLVDIEPLEMNCIVHTPIKEMRINVEFKEGQLVNNYFNYIIKA